MNAWKDHLKADPTEWLLEEDNPSVRYLTLTGLLDRTRRDAEVSRARSAIMKSGAVPKIAARLEGVNKAGAGRFYKDKYRGTAWQLIILAEHEADGRDARIEAACDYILAHSQDRESGGFSVSARAGGLGGRHGEVIPCLTGNMVWSLLKLGRGNDPRVQAGIRWISRYQRFDDGEGRPPAQWPYERYQMCWGAHSCFMGVVKSLKALSAVAPRKRTPDMSAAIQRGCDYLLRHHVYKQSHNLARTARPGWRRLQFPLMYQTDVLEVVNVLLDCGVVDGRMQEAIDLIADKQTTSGRWVLESTFNGRFLVDIEWRGRPSKWITFRCLRALKRYYG